MKNWNVNLHEHLVYTFPMIVTFVLLFEKIECELVCIN